MSQPKEKHKFPPFYYLSEVLKNIPRTGLLYLQLWDKADKNNQIFVKHRDIRIDFFISLTRFRNDLHYLERDGLLTVFEVNCCFTIELKGWEDES